MTGPDEKFAALKWKLNRKLQKPLGHHDERAVDRVTEVEMHAPDPETHGQGAHAVESERPEQGKLCPSCKSPTHAHDTKCPWCGAGLPST